MRVKIMMNHFPAVERVIRRMRSLGVERLYMKPLAPNDNSKNQVYLGSDFSAINIIPYDEIETDQTAKKPNYKAKIRFYWLGDTNQIWNAPYAQLILYPQYPEVRMSGFLLGCSNAPSELMAHRQDGRLLFLGVTDDRRVLGYVVDAESNEANEFEALKNQLETIGVFYEIPIVVEDGQINSREALLHELKRIHELGWINAKRLQADGTIVPCRGVNCGGYTLEAELGITPNALAEPDYMGWEVKQHTVSDFDRPATAKAITLMTPEPTGGYYKDAGVEAFVRKYGYPDTKGKPDRINFSSPHRFSITNDRTGLTLTLSGYDEHTHRVVDIGGGIHLVNKFGESAAIWHFESLVKHWNRKHARAVYVPSKMKQENIRQYAYGSMVRLGVGTDFLQLLHAIVVKSVYYDPGIKLENSSLSRPKLKQRSQFRISSSSVPTLYKNAETVSVYEQ